MNEQDEKYSQWKILMEWNYPKVLNSSPQRIHRTLTRWKLADSSLVGEREMLELFSLSYYNIFVCGCVGMHVCWCGLGVSYALVAFLLEFRFSSWIFFLVSVYQLPVYCVVYSVWIYIYFIYIFTYLLHLSILTFSLLLCDLSLCYDWLINICALKLNRMDLT